MDSKDKYSRLTYSYLDLRKAVGLIGILLPFVLMLGLLLFFNQENTPASISHYYYTSMRNVFVGALSAVALFMFFYSGHDILDDWTGNVAGFFAIGVAWFPTTEIVGQNDFIGIIHYISAGIFFLSLAVFSLFLFTKTKDELTKTDRKKTRNKIYITCGIIILLSMIIIAFYKLLGLPSNTVFWAETVALVAFGFSWITKGGTLYPDKE